MQTRDDDEYPMAIQQAGPYAKRVFDRVEQGLLSDGFTPDEAEMLMQINMSDIIEQAQAEEEQDKGNQQQ